MVADDYANRISRRALHVGFGDRPTPDDINDLRRRQDEHAKRTRPTPQKSFHETLADNNRQDAHGEAHDDAHEGPPEKSPNEFGQGAAVGQSIKPLAPNAGGSHDGRGHKTSLPTLGRRHMIRA